MCNCIVATHWITLLYIIIIFTKNIIIRKQVCLLISKLMGSSTFILIRNTMKASMFAEQKSSLPKGVGLLSRTLRSTGDPPETWVPNLDRKPCCQCMQKCLKSLRSCLKVETDLAALEWLSGKAWPTLWSTILVHFISLFFFPPVFSVVSDISG